MTDKAVVAARAAAASALLANETFNAACEDIARLLAVQWAATAPEEIRERENMHLTLQGIGALRSELQRRVDEHKINEAEDAKRERRKKEI